MSEAEYLARQAADAKAALAQTFHEIGQPLERAANEHPLLVIGAAAIAGALAARVVSPASHNGRNDKPPAPSLLSGVIADTIQPVIKDLAVAAVAAIAAMLAKEQTQTP